MRRIATRGELSRWRQQLASLPRARRIAAIRMLSEIVSHCEWCDGPVRRCDSRGLVVDRLVHLRCAPAHQLTAVQRDALADREARQ
jgi:hypothetical protein